MLLLLFSILIAASLFVSFHLKNKIYNQRRQLLLLKYQNNNLKYITKTDKLSDITIKYMDPEYTKGIISADCKLLLAPQPDYTALSSLSQNTIVEVQDSAEVNNELWYEISLLTENRVNSKGWIKSQYINAFVENE